MCIRKPEISSLRSSTLSRSRRQYQSIEMAPISSPLVPSQIMWEEIRQSSHMITRSACARGVASTPISFSTAIA